MHVILECKSTPSSSKVSITFSKGYCEIRLYIIVAQGSLRGYPTMELFHMVLAKQNPLKVKVHVRTGPLCGD